MDTFLNKLALRIKIYNISGSVMHHVALLKKALDKQNIKCEIIKGFCIIENTNEACQHYWVRLEEGLDLDIGFAVAKLKSPELQALHPVLLDSLPPGLSRTDTEATEILAENLRLFELFHQDSKAFWRESPQDVLSFQVKKTDLAF